MANGNYEFSDKDLTFLSSLSKTIRSTSYILMTLGLLTVLYCLSIKTFGYLFIGLFQIFVGLWTFKTALAFRLFPPHNKPQNLIGALEYLRKLYTFKFWIYGLACLILLFSIAAISAIMSVRGY